ncbi:MAG: hypothetical protein ACRD5M_03215 [Candidatus Acidiferrales bacterium]
MVALTANRLVALFLLPSRVTGQHARTLFRAWAWLDQKTALYGWVPLAVGLLAWDLFVWRNSRPKVKGWVTRKLLTLALMAGVAPIIPSWLPTDQPPKNFLAAISKYPGLAASLAWAVVVFVVTLLCINAETRDSLLGHGKVLSLISLGILLLLITLTIVGWSIA